jgi:hypothetical protein
MAPLLFFIQTDSKRSTRQARGQKAIIMSGELGRCVTDPTIEQAADLHITRLLRSHVAF